MPILAVPASVTTIPRRVIAAIDFSPTSMHAARTAAAWLRLVMSCTSCPSCLSLATLRACCWPARGSLTV